MRIFKVDTTMFNVTMSHPEYGTENFTIAVQYENDEFFSTPFNDIFKVIIEEYDKYRCYFEYEFSTSYVFDNEYIELTYNYDYYNDIAELINKKIYSMKEK